MVLFPNNSHFFLNETDAWRFSRIDPRGKCGFSSLAFLVALLFFGLSTGRQAANLLAKDDGRAVLEKYCLDCHQGDQAEAGQDFNDLGGRLSPITELIFENVATGKMPPADSDHPDKGEKRLLLEWLASRGPQGRFPSFRRLSRSEFVQSSNDLLGIRLDLTERIPDDRGSFRFDSNRRIALSQEVLSSYFSVADQMLEFALPRKGFPVEQEWVTSKLKDSHSSYNIYVKDFRDGLLFSWTRANNGNSYSFFYDHFEPPVSGWYELTFDAAKVGDFPETVSLQVHGGKYYFADDRPQPQRLLGVISLDNPEVQSHKKMVFMEKGENVSVHLHSKHTFRKKNPNAGGFIRQMRARGPVHESWPPPSFKNIFPGLTIHAGKRTVLSRNESQSNLQKIGGRLTVSSFQPGMEKEKMQDGSNQTFWHTRFHPTLAKGPHFVVLENPMRVPLHGLRYATWSGGNGNGQVKSYSVESSSDGENWNEPIVSGKLETRLANEQFIVFPKPVDFPFLRFLITDSFSIDGRSLASVGKLDVMTRVEPPVPTQSIEILGSTAAELEGCIRRFAERAFSSRLTSSDLAPYVEIGRQELERTGDFVLATRLAIKAILSSPRFLLFPGKYSNDSYARAAFLAKVIWRSVPDQKLLEVCRENRLSVRILDQQIKRMMSDPRSRRMVQSLTRQWLNLRAWKTISPSLKLYPLYDDLLDHFLPMETEMYLHYLIQENRPVSELIDSDYSFLNQRLAQHYGIPGVFGTHMRKVAFPDDVPRGGLLTMGSILKVTTDGFDTSPILRGAWVSRNIAGIPLSPPPENVKAIEPDLQSATSLREQIDKHKNTESCASCHKSIDPYGFALESFDASGQWRFRYRTRLPHRGTFQYRRQGYYKMGDEVDASGEVNGKEFRGVTEFKEILNSNQQRIAYNFARKFFEYTNGYAPDFMQRLELLKMIEDQNGSCHTGDLVRRILVFSLEELNR